MNKLKIMTVIGTRPEIIRLSRTIPCLDQYFEQILVHTGQNYDYELNEIFFNELEIRKPDYFLNAAGINGTDTIGKILIEMDSLLESENPDALLVLGDTNSCMAIIAAKKRRIPTFHMEAGNRCFDMRVPEEINRRIVDHTADINLPYSSIAREYLLREGLPPEQIIKTGSPMNEVLQYYLPKISASKVLDQLELTPQQFFLVSAHREENIDSPVQFQKLISCLNLLATEYQLPVVVSTHPRTQKRIESDQAQFHPLVKLMKPLGFFDYNHLQISAKAVLSDSGTINEEASILNFPALNIRETHERPEGMEEAVVMMVGFEWSRIKQALIILENQARGKVRLMTQVIDYSAPVVSEKIARIILSYTNFVNRVVWQKY